MKVIKILLEFEGWDPNGSKKTLKKVFKFLPSNLIPSPDYHTGTSLRSGKTFFGQIYVGRPK